MNSMRYNPSQAQRLLLDPLISDLSRQVEDRIRGFLHSEPDETRTPYPGRFLRIRPIRLIHSRAAHDRLQVYCEPSSSTTTVFDKDLKRIAARRILKRIPISPA